MLRSLLYSLLILLIIIGLWGYYEYDQFKNFFSYSVTGVKITGSKRDANGDLIASLDLTVTIYNPADFDATINSLTGDVYINNVLSITQGTLSTTTLKAKANTDVVITLNVNVTKLFGGNLLALVNGTLEYQGKLTATVFGLKPTVPIDFKSQILSLL